MIVKSFVIFVSLVLVVSSSPKFYRNDASVYRLSDLGMHPHMPQIVHDHKKVKRSTEYQINNAEFTNEYWIDNARKLVDKKVKSKYNTKKAKNVIFFLGDGMSHMTIAAARVQQGDESSKFSWENFPFTASAKTYCVDSMVADSACSGNAFLHGIKNNKGVIGLNGNAIRSNCNDTNDEDKYTTSIASWFLDEGRNAGIVTTTKLTDATPAVVYGNIAERNWQGNEDVSFSKCDHSEIYDLAEQFVRGPVGSKLKVALAGGSKYFINSTSTEHGEKGVRTDGKNLINEWKGAKSKRIYVGNRMELVDLDLDDVDQLLGLFHSDHIPYHLETETKNQEMFYPTLTEMTLKALEVLEDDENGYFLLAEGGRIDHGNHKNKARLAIDEVIEFSKAIQAVVDKVDLDETLVVVTADHSHVMTVGGYQARGTDIFSAPNNATDGLPYFTISYANGPGFSKHIKNGQRVDPRTLDSSSIDFMFPSTVHRTDDTHGGEDVGIWAVGPNAHLFQGTIEQNLIAHIMAYASCVGDGLTVCN